MKELQESAKQFLAEYKSLTLKGDISKTHQLIGYLEKHIKQSDAKNQRLMLSTLKDIKSAVDDVAKTANRLNK